MFACSGCGCWCWCCVASLLLSSPPFLRVVRLAGPTARNSRQGPVDLLPHPERSIQEETGQCMSDASPASCALVYVYVRVHVHVHAHTYLRMYVYVCGSCWVDVYKDMRLNSCVCAFLVIFFVQPPSSLSGIQLPTEKRWWNAARRELVESVSKRMV